MHYSLCIRFKKSTHSIKADMRHAERAQIAYTKRISCMDAHGRNSSARQCVVYKSFFITLVIVMRETSNN